MVAFREWLYQEERRIVDPAVMTSYEKEFRRHLESLINRTRNPELKRTFDSMRSCPVKDSSGKCYSFTGWIINSLSRHGCYQRVDPEAALNYIAFRLLSTVGERGQSRKSVFDFDESMPYEAGTNPMEARFKTYVVRDIRNICGMRVQKLRNVNRPEGTLTITPRGKQDMAPGTIGPDEIPAPQSGREQELIGDLMDLIKKRTTPTMPLAAIFQAMVEGIPLNIQRKRFGHTTADRGRKEIRNIVSQYAAKTQNHELLRLLTTPPAKKPKPERSAPKSKLPPAIQDYVSILDVINKNGGMASMAVLGKKRRRWLERKPRNPHSHEKDRLHDVLASMVDDGVLSKRGAVYSQGPNSQSFMNKARALAAARP